MNVDICRYVYSSIILNNYIYNIHEILYVQVYVKILKPGQLAMKNLVIR